MFSWGATTSARSSKALLEADLEYFEFENLPFHPTAGGDKAQCGT